MFTSGGHMMVWSHVTALDQLGDFFRAVEHGFHVVTSRQGDPNWIYSILEASLAIFRSS
jgi:hypothetical protein